MGNFEYIISSLPFLTADFKYAEGQGFGQVMEEIRESLSEKDAQALDFLLKGFQDSELTPEFYAEAEQQSLPFLRDYFDFDRNVRNRKVRYLNKQLGRPEEEDLVRLREEEPEFEQEATVDAALGEVDLISREKALDDIAWAWLDEYAMFHYFDLTAVLAYVAKLHIVNRWLSLDEEVGREQFRRLIKEIRGTYKGVKYSE